MDLKLKMELYRIHIRDQYRAQQAEAAARAIKQAQTQRKES
jgi:hypothetical protein